LSSELNSEIINKQKNQFFVKLIEKLKEPETKSILIILLIAFLIRFILSLLFNTGHPTDINNFKVWSMEVTKRGVFDFFQPAPKGVWCDYPPLYVYVLYAVGSIYRLFDPLFQNWPSVGFTAFVKFPAIIAEVVNVYLIFYISRKYVPFAIAASAATLYSFQPAMIHESAIWGQMDSVSLLFLLLSVLYLISGKYSLALLVTAVNILIKPQGVILLPFILFVIAYNKAFKQLAIGTALSFALVFLTTLPVTHSIINVIPWLWQHYIAQADLYPYSSIQSFNLWGLTGLWKEDSRVLLGLSHKTWGLILFVGFYIFSCYYYVRNIKLKDDDSYLKYDRNGISIIFAATLILLAFFFLPTRMHERYLFPGLSFLAIVAALNCNVKNFYYLLSGTFFLNILYEFPGDKTNLGFPSFFAGFVNWLKSGHMINETFGIFTYTPVILLNLALFVIIIVVLNKKQLLNIDYEAIEAYENKSVKEPVQEKKKFFFVPQIQKFDSMDMIIIFALMLASTLIRIFYLKFPEEMSFDEVYHARAAGEYLRGVAPFEWVHPPLAKLIISVGVMVFGLNSFGWRISALLFGSLFMPVMYILGKSLFGKRSLGILAALLISMDGVFIIQSRVAMTNIFATFFQIASVMFFWLYFQYDVHDENKKKSYTFFFLSGLFMAIALATRWTSAGSLFFIGGALIWHKFLSKISISDILSGDFRIISNCLNYKELRFWLLAIFSFGILPFCVYILAYTPYILLGHNLHDIFKMQVDIFNYHKNLRDPHPYYSEWYTWPFLIRPTWYYFRDFKDGTIGGIIALGNPIIWWSSLFAVGFVLYKAIKDKMANLLYVGLAFIALYLPWAVSPRVKNYNHYLFEAIPYACLALVYILSSLWDKGNQKKTLDKEDKMFNLLAIISVAILTVYLILVGCSSYWVNTLHNPFPIEALVPYTKRIFDSVLFTSISLVIIVLYALFENGKFKAISIIYFSSIVLLFLFFYPLYIGYPIPWWYYNIHIWLTSWV